MSTLLWVAYSNACAQEKIDMVWNIILFLRFKKWDFKTIVS